MTCTVLVVFGFNPCFDGSVARGNDPFKVMYNLIPGFNPCFDGSVARGAETSVEP